MEKIKNYSFNFISLEDNEKNKVSKLWFYVFFNLRSGGDHRRAICYFIRHRLAGLLDTTVAYLVGETQANDLLKDVDMLKRLKDINDLPEQDKQAILYNLDALLRDAKTRLAYK